MRYRHAHPIAAALAVSAIAMGSPATGAKATDTCPLPSFGPGAAYHPQIDPANFSPNVDNSYMPLRARADRSSSRAPTVGPLDEFDGDDECDGERDLVESVMDEAVGISP